MTNLYCYSLCFCVVFGNCEIMGEMPYGAGKVLVLYVKFNNTDTVRDNILTLTPVNTTYMQISFIHMPMRIFKLSS